MNKTDRATLLEIFKNAGIQINWEDDTKYFEIEPNNYGENVGFEFDENGNLISII